MTARLTQAKRVVVKIGSTLLIDKTEHAVNEVWLRAMAEDIALLRSRGQDVVIVSSGAIALGRKKLALHDGILRLEESQAAAAAGQLDLVNAYQRALTPHDLTVAQILLTPTDTEERRRYLNARHTIETLLSIGAIPIINENDTVATSEIRFGDNDRLAARVANMISADCLVLLSDIDGLYDKDPRKNGNAAFVSEVEEITSQIEAMAGTTSSKTGNNFGSGGMATKIEAAKIAVRAGCHMAIANGTECYPLNAISEGARCTWFVAHENPRAARKQWIAATLAPQGKIVIDAGAVKALRAGKSLLPAGVTSVSGSFERGDAIVVSDQKEGEIARGLIAYAKADAEKIIGYNSQEIEKRLGYSGRPEMIHRDDLVLTETTKIKEG